MSCAGSRADAQGPDAAAAGQLADGNVHPAQPSGIAMRSEPDAMRGCCLAYLNVPTPDSGLALSSSTM